MFAGWAADKQRVATAFGIVDNGDIFQAFGSQYWAWHINILSKGNAAIRQQAFKPYAAFRHAEALEMHSIGYEFCNWGGLTLKDGKLLTWTGHHIKDEKRVIEYETPFRGFNYFERYTDQELESARVLLRYHCQRYNIPSDYNPDMWEVTTKAVGGVPGIWTHASYRSDKNDCHPQPELIEMLKSL